MGEDLSTEFMRHVKPQWASLHVVARRYVVGADDARDLVQEALLRAWRSYSPSDGRSYGRAWLYVIMRSVAIDWSRLTKRRVRLVPSTHEELTEIASVDLTEPFSPLPAMDEGRFLDFLDDRVAGALNALDPSFREVVMLSVAGDLTYREIADVLDCPAGTVMSRMARARRALRDQLADYARATGWAKEGRS